MYIHTSRSFVLVPFIPCGDVSLLEVKTPHQPKNKSFCIENRFSDWYWKSVFTDHREFVICYVYISHSSAIYSTHCHLILPTYVSSELRLSTMAYGGLGWRIINHDVHYKKNIFINFFLLIFIVKLKVKFIYITEKYGKTGWFIN